MEQLVDESLAQLPLLQHDEAAMQSFIRHHLGVILKPFLEDAGALSDEVQLLSERMAGYDAALASDRQDVEAARQDVRALRQASGKTEDRLDKIHAGVEAFRRAGEHMSEGLFLANEHLERVHHIAEDGTELAQYLQSRVGGAECELQALRSNVQRLTDGTYGDMQKRLDDLLAQHQTLGGAHDETCRGLQKFRTETEQRDRALLDVHHGHKENVKLTQGMRKDVDGVLSRDAKSGSRFEELRQQLQKLQSAQTGLQKDLGALRHDAERDQGALSKLQQTHATSFAMIEAIQEKKVGVGDDVSMLRRNVAGLEGGFEGLKDSLAAAGAFAKSLHVCLLKSDDNVSHMAAKMQSFDESRQECVDSMVTLQGDLQHVSAGQKRQFADADRFRQDLDATNQTLHAVRGDVADSKTNHQSMQAELERVDDTVQRLDRSVELCRSGFVGLQKGFVDTSVHVASRTTALPRIFAKDGILSKIDTTRASANSTLIASEVTQSPSDLRASVDADDLMT